MLRIYAPEGDSVESCEVEGSASEVFAQVGQVLALVLDQFPDPSVGLYVLLSSLSKLYDESTVVDAVKYFMEEYILEHDQDNDST